MWVRVCVCVIECFFFHSHFLFYFVLFSVVLFRSIPVRSDIENKIYYTFFFFSHFYLLWLAFIEEKTTQRYFFLLILFIQKYRQIDHDHEQSARFVLKLIISLLLCLLLPYSMWEKSAVSWLIGFHLPSKSFFRSVCLCECVRAWVFSFVVVRPSFFSYDDLQWTLLTMYVLAYTLIQLCILCFLFLPFCNFFRVSLDDWRRVVLK